MNPNYSATMEFSNHELKFIMPKLLCDAWGITRYPLNMIVKDYLIDLK